MSVCGFPRCGDECRWDSGFKKVPDSRSVLSSSYDPTVAARLLCDVAMNVYKRQVASVIPNANVYQMDDKSRGDGENRSDKCTSEIKKMNFCKYTRYRCRAPIIEETLFYGACLMPWVSGHRSPEPSFRAPTPDSSGEHGTI